MYNTGTRDIFTDSLKFTSLSSIEIELELEQSFIRNLRPNLRLLNLIVSISSPFGAKCLIIYLFYTNILFTQRKKGIKMAHLQQAKMVYEKEEIFVEGFHNWDLVY